MGASPVYLRGVIVIDKFCSDWPENDDDNDELSITSDDKRHSDQSGGGDIRTRYHFTIHSISNLKIVS